MYNDEKRNKLICSYSDFAAGPFTRTESGNDRSSSLLERRSPRLFCSAAASETPLNSNESFRFFSSSSLINLIREDLSVPRRRLVQGTKQ